MTISAASSNRVRLAGTGSELNFNFDFRILDENDLLVVVQDVNGVDTTKTITTDYTVTGVDQATGGTVTFLVAPLATDFVSIILDPAVEQPTSLSNKGQLPSRSIERGLDRAINIIKRTRDLVARALTLGEGDVDGSGAYDANSNRIENLGAAVNDNDAMQKVAVQALIDAAVITPSVTVSAFGASLIDDADATAALTTLGTSAKARNLLVLPDNATWLTELGIVSAEMQAFLAATNLPDARTNLGVPPLIAGKNLMVNSDFQVWQWGTTFTGSVPYTGAANDNVFQPDQWKFLTATSGAVHSNKPAVNDQDGSAKGSYRLVQQTANVKWGVWQTLESQRSLPLAGKSVSLGISIKAPNDLKQFKLLLCSWNGTADDLSATPDPVSAWNAAQVRPTLAGAWSLVSGGELDITVVGSGWERFELENVTIPASGYNNLAVFLCTNDGSFSGSGATEVKLTGVKLEVGPVCTTYESPTYVEELRECQRFYAKTIPGNAYPVDNAGLASAIGDRATEWGGGNYGWNANWDLPVEMLKAPTVSVFNPGSGTAGYLRRADNAADYPAAPQPVTQNLGQNRVSLYAGPHAAPAPTSGENYFIHAAADARL